jgi:hypothetical protein
MAAVRSQMHTLLLAHPRGLLGSQIPVAYKAKHHVSWKEACQNRVASLRELLSTPGFFQQIGFSGVDCLFQALPV